MPKEKERIKQCFSLDRGFVEKLDSLSNRSGVPKSRILENCFGDTDRLDDFEKFCSGVKKRKEGE